VTVATIDSDYNKFQTMVCFCVSALCGVCVFCVSEECTISI